MAKILIKINTFSQKFLSYMIHINKKQKKINQYLLFRLWNNISKLRRKQLLFLLILTFFTSLAEVVSLSAVLPFLGILSGSEIIIEYKIIQDLIKFITNNFGRENLFLSLTLVFISASIIAGTMRVVLLWGQTKLGHAIGSDLSNQVYFRTLHQPLSVHVARNSSEVIAGISNKVNIIVGNIIVPVLVIINSIFMMIAIITTLIFIDPFIAFSAILSFSILYFIFSLFTKKRLVSNSEKITSKINLVIKTINEGLGGIRDILIDGSQSSYCDKFRSADLAYRKALANNQIMSQAPRYGVEAIGMSLIALLAFNLGGDGQGIVESLPLLGALALAAQKVIPLLQGLYASWSKIKGSKAVLIDSLILIEQRVPDFSYKKHKSEKVDFFNSIELRDINFRFNSNDSLVLKDINLKISKGMKLGIIGTTGSGKSTLIDIVMGLLNSEKGSLLVDGKKINENNQQSWQSHIAHIPQKIFLSDTSVYENIAFGIPEEKILKDKVHEVARHAQLDDVIRRWKHGYKTIIGENGIRLSGGQRQRIGIARALYKGADLMILDEATSALDKNTEEKVMNAINNLNQTATLIIIAHRFSTLKKCDLIINLENGRIEDSGSYEDIIE